MRPQDSCGAEGAEQMAVGSPHGGIRAAARHLTRHCLATLLLVPLIQIDAQRPGSTVGFVNEVRGVGRESSCDRLAPVPTARGVLTIVRASGPISAWPRDVIVLGDSLKVQSLNDVHVQIDPGAFGVGNFFLAPQLGRCPEVVAALRVSGISLSDGRAGSYTFRSRREQTPQGAVERLIFEIEYGGAYVQWARGPLTIVALGREIPIRGTDVALIVEPDANVVLLYLREGIIELAGVRLADPGVFRFGRQGPPQRITVPQQFVDNMAFHGREVWRRPLLEVGARAAGAAPRGGLALWKVLGVAALVGGAGYLAYDLWIRPDPKQPPRRGTVGINIPL